MKEIRMLSRVAVCFMKTPVVRCARHRFSAAPKLHDILEYWHKVRKGEVDPVVKNEKSKEYWGKVQAGQGSPFMREVRIPERSWSIHKGVMRSIRNTFYRNHRCCDTVFDYNDRTDIDFKSKLEACINESDFKKLEVEFARSVSKYSLKDLVYLMDGFLQREHEPKELLAVTCKHLVFNFSNEEKSPSSILHLLYIIGCSRNVPRELLGEIENYLKAHIDQFKLSDFAVIGFAYMVTNEPITSYTILHAMAEEALVHVREKTKYSSHSDVYHDYSNLVQLYKSFAHSKFYSLKFYTEMGDLLIDLLNRIDNIRGPQFMTIIRAYAAAGVKHDDLFAKLLEKINIEGIFQGIETVPSKSLVKHGGTRAKDVFRFLWAFGSLRVPVDGVWLQAAVALLSEEELLVRYPHMLVEGLIALSMFDIHPTPLYRKLYDPNFLRRIDVSVKGEKMNYYQLHVLHQYIKLEHPGLKQTNVLERIFKDRRTFRQKLEVSLTLKKGLAHYWNSLQHILGGECVTLKYLIPVSGVADIVIHLDKKNVPIPQINQYDDDTTELLKGMPDCIQEYVEDGVSNSIIANLQRTHSLTGEPLDRLSDMQSLTEIHILPENPPKHRKICIRVLGENQCFKNQPGTLGHITFENKLITKMGYEIFLIDPVEAQNMVCTKPEGREDIVRENILKRLNINTDTV